MKNKYLAPILAGCLILLAVAIGTINLRDKAAKSTLTPGSLANVVNGGVDAAQDSALRQLLSVFSTAPSFSQAKFGRGVRAAAFRERWIIGDSLVTPDGTLYVTLMPPNNVDLTDKYAVATLFLGNVRVISLPSTARGYISMVFVGSGSAALLEVGDPVRGFRLFRLSPTNAVELPYQKIAQRPVRGTLANGERCEQPQNPGSAFILMAVNAQGFVHPILTRSALVQGTQGTITDDRYISMYCSSFDGQNFVTMVAGGDWGVVYRLMGDRLQAVSRGRVAASGVRHMLISQTEEGPQGSTGFQDYLDIVK